MPDPTRQTISATQIPGVLCLSPYSTPLTVYHELRGVSVPRREDFRMWLGKKMQPIILERLQMELGLETVGNPEDDYTRHPSLPIGATIDGRVRDPNRGTGIIEAKNVAADAASGWHSGLAPVHIELQIQVQMMVDGTGWGLIAGLIGGGRLERLEREPVALYQEKIAAAAQDMMARVREGRPPAATGLEPEAALVAALYPEVEPDLRLELDDPLLATDAEQYLAQTEIRAMAEDRRSQARIKLLAAMGMASLLRLPGYLCVRRADKNGRITLVVRETDA